MSNGQFLEGEDYEFLERPNSELYSVRLLTTDWAGVIYTYGSVGFKEDKANDQVILKFTLRIEDPLQFGVTELESDPEFKMLTGHILQAILSSELFSIGKQPKSNKQD